MKKATILMCLLCFGLCAPSLADPNNPRVVISTIVGDITIELFPNDAQVTVDNFLYYTNTGFYDGLIIHRAINNFMIQGGTFEPGLIKRTDGLRPAISNEADNGLLNSRGTISMALLPGEPNSGTSGFFINQVNNTHLDGLHTVFGEVLEGMDVVDFIAQLPHIPTQYTGGMQDVPYYPAPDGNDYWVYVYETFITPDSDLFEADINYDGIVDEQDLSIIGASWLSPAELGDMEVVGDVDFREFAQFARSWKRTSVWYRDFAGDIDNNKTVNFKDFSYLARDWGKNGDKLYGDLNLDNTVNYLDLRLLADDWLKQLE